jgi:hypothetical protein
MQRHLELVKMAISGKLLFFNFKSRSLLASLLLRRAAFRHNC